MYSITLESPLALLQSIALLVHENYIMFETKQVGERKSQKTKHTFTTTMFIIRHPRHRTGVHTDAVTISSGTPGPPITASR
jgi:hypothetical protein